jgi:hypothetical protein
LDQVMSLRIVLHQRVHPPAPFKGGGVVRLTSPLEHLKNPRITCVFIVFHRVP